MSVNIENLEIKGAVFNGTPINKIYKGKTFIWGENGPTKCTITKTIDSETEIEIIDEGDYTGKITFPIKPNFFGGWYMDENFTTPANFSDIREDMNVFAKYVPSTDITVSAARKAGKIGDVTFTFTVSFSKFSSGTQPIDVGVICDHNGLITEGMLTKKTYVNVGSTSKYTYKFSGPIVVKELESTDNFSIFVFWTTRDKTNVQDYFLSTAKYSGGSCKVTKQASYIIDISLTNPIDSSAFNGGYITTGAFLETEESDDTIIEKYNIGEIINPTENKTIRVYADNPIIGIHLNGASIPTEGINCTDGITCIKNELGISYYQVTANGTITIDSVNYNN